MALYKVKADANQPEMQKLNDKQQRMLKMAMEMQQNKVEVSLANRELKLMRAILGVDKNTKQSTITEMFIAKILNNYKYVKK